jgi:hypothetical protein
MRKTLAGLLGLFAALTFTLALGSPAQAADGVSDQRCTETDTSLGRICVVVTFDNTNCDAHSTNNCSGLNGAKVTAIKIQTSSGTAATNAVLLSLDSYGDSTSAYGSARSINFHLESTRTWAAFPSSLAGVNRVCVRVRSASAAATSGVNVGGMNPYGLSRAGACNLP